MQIQEMCLFPGNAADDNLRATLHLMTTPNIQNLLEIAPWAVWRSALRKWLVDDVAHEGNAIVCSTSDDFHGFAGTDALALPTLVVLERLLGLGWIAGRDSSEDHTDPDDKRFCVSGGLRTRRLYFMCLLSIQELVAYDFVLSCSQPASYYKAVLSLPCEKLSDVRCGLKAIDYARMLALPIEGAQELQLALVDEGGVSEEDILYATPLSEMQLSLGSKGKTTDRRKRLTEGEDIQQEDANSGFRICDNEGDELTPLFFAGACVVPSSAASSSASSSSIKPQLQRSNEPPSVREKRPRLSVDEVADMKAEATSPSIPSSICGVKITVDAFSGSLNSSEAYVRKRVTCKRHKNCFKFRNTSFLTTFGQLEVVGYLGVWLSKGCEYADRAEHMQFKPAVSDVKQFLLGEGLIKE